jgi:hypothetical protein
MMKVCSCCRRPAEYSLVSILSTVGISKRQQKCSPAVLFCTNCLKKRLQRKHWGSDDLHEAVNSAYTELYKRLQAQSTSM